VFALKSSAFEDGQRMPVKYANTGVGGGQNISIPLSWENPPEGTKSFAVATVDRHPVANNWVHWLVINIPGSVISLPEGASGTNNMPAGAKELNNTFGFQGYGGPQPPPGTGDHDYETTIYALNVEGLNLEANTSLGQFMDAIQGRVLGSAKLTGKFSR
jgi:Raf kinase inhibitor-like YbhB/YbcL family protein